VSETAGSRARMGLIRARRGQAWPGVARRGQAWRVGSERQGPEPPAGPDPRRWPQGPDG